MNATTDESKKPSYWQMVFLQSKANGTNYSEDDLPGGNWVWPKETYLQRRLESMKRRPSFSLFQLN